MLFPDFFEVHFRLPADGRRLFRPGGVAVTAGIE